LTNSAQFKKSKICSIGVIKYIYTNFKSINTFFKVLVEGKTLFWCIIGHYFFLAFMLFGMAFLDPGSKVGAKD